MKSNSSKTNRYLLASVSSAALLFPMATASAQQVQLPNAPINQVIDERGVDIATGQLATSITPLSIGDTANGLSLSLTWAGVNGFRNNHMISAVDDSGSYAGIAAGSGFHFSVTIGAIAHGFTKSGSSYLPDEGDGTSFTISSDSKSYTFTDRGGGVLTLSRANYPYKLNYYGTVDAVATQYVRPDGFKVRYTYNTGTPALDSNTPEPIRLQSVNTSSGFQLKFWYPFQNITGLIDSFSTIGSVTAVNSSTAYCDPSSALCTTLVNGTPVNIATVWPSATFGYGFLDSNGNKISGNYQVNVKDSASRYTSYLIDTSNRIIGVMKGYGLSYYSIGNTATQNINSTNTPFFSAIYSYVGTQNRISTVNFPGIGAWNYSYANGTCTCGNGDGTSIVTVTPPAMGGANPATPVPRTYVIDVVRVAPLSYQDENGHTTTYTYDNTTTVNNFLTTRIKTITLDGTGANFTTYNYDTRSNVTSMVMTPKSGSGLSTISSQAAYPVDPCTNAATCNKPITTTDSAGQVTNYYYNTNGTLNYVQLPAPTTGGVRPEVHYSYASGQAQVMSSGGTLVAQGDVVSLPTGTTTCASGAYATCPAANLVTSQIAYPGGSTPTSFLPQSTTVKSGDGAVNSMTSAAYDNIGNVTSTTDPMGNTSTVTYAADRQPLLAVGPSIDGSSTSARSAVQYQYGLDGVLSTVTAGSYNPSTQALTPSVVTTTNYDAQDRPTTRSVSDGTTTYALTQYSYNGIGKVDCSAVRMNPATFTSLPASACTLGTQGSDGADRITQYKYDLAGNVLATDPQLGVSSNFAPSYTLTNHNLVQTMVDGNGNTTSFVYDGFDRLARTCYQGTLAACQANTSTDYVTQTYDSAGRLLNRSIRGAPTSLITYGYDNRSRVTSVTYPGGGTYDQAVTMTYDNLGRTLTASDSSGDSLAYTYDALNDVLTEGDGVSTRTMAYDKSGRRTKLAWADSRYVMYQYDGNSALKQIQENGATVLATYAYDAIGRRSSLTLGNGVVTNYANYTPLGLGTMTIDLPGTANDLTLTFAYNAAGQIKTRTSNSANSAWLYQNYTNISHSYTANGLNQYSASGASTPTYDAKGNLTSASSASVYAYSTKNELITRSDNGASFYHDPSGRLDKITVGATSTRLQYNGASILNEVDGGSGAMLRRYVHGAGADEPLVWYEGADFSNKRFLVADERGSIIAATDATGNPIFYNTYDEYGVTPPNNAANANQGRFQYTGQAWINELGMNSYKARIYSPMMGRFLQTDPAGYPDGPNWYGYAMNDPVNVTDPTGLDGQYCDALSVCVTVPANGPPPSDTSFQGDDYGTLYGSTGDVYHFSGVVVPAPQSYYDPYLTGDFSPPNLSSDSSVWYSGPLLAPPSLRGPSIGMSQSPTPRIAIDDPDCNLALAQKGKIGYTATSLAAIVGGGITGSWGKFRNFRTGTTGKFFSLAGGGGFDGGVSQSIGTADSLALMNGGGASFNLSGGPLTYSANGSLGDTGITPSGSSGGVSFGTPIGVSATLSGTRAYGCKVRGQ